MIERLSVHRLRAKLEEAGIDVDALLEGIGDDDEDSARWHGDCGCVARGYRD